MREQAGPYDNVAVGTMLLTLVEPHRGHEVDYNRWYERDHFYAGCMIGAGWFAGKRWVATRELKDLRLPTDPTPGEGFLPGHERDGSYLATYWVQKGVDAEAIAWGSEQVRWLHDNDRMFPHRDHVHTLMYVHRWSIERAADGVPTALALDHPWGGLAVITVDRAAEDPPREFSAWLADEALPGALPADGPVAKVAGFTPIPLPEGAPVTQPENPGHDRRLVLLAFLDQGPEEAWPAVRTLVEHLEGTGRATASWAAPFLPTVPGTDRYTDQLW